MFHIDTNALNPKFMYSIKLYLYHYLFIIIKASKDFHQIFNMYLRIKIHYRTHTIKFEEDLPTINQITKINLKIR